MLPITSKEVVCATQPKLIYLDGLRGILALSVIGHHFVGIYGLPTSDFRIFSGPGTYIGVPGFFILSSFLLTYRLLVDFDNTKQKSQTFAVVRIFAKYTIRRFCRIYLTYVVFLVILYSISEKWNIIDPPKTSFIKSALLYRGIGNWLWTIQPECQYYCLIPFISLFTMKSEKYWCLIVAVIIPIISVIDHLYPDANEIPYIRCLNMFAKGSIIAILYFNIKKSPRACELLENKNLQMFLKISIFIILLYQIRFFSYLWNKQLKLTYRSYSSSIMAIYMFLLLLVEDLYCLKQCYNSAFLRLCGKYSFGIYLFHNLILGFVHSIRHSFKSTIECFVLSIILAYFVGLVWFYVAENVFIKLANRLCVHIDKRI